MGTLRRLHIQGLTLPDSKTYNNATVVKTLRHGTGVRQTYRSMEQNRESENRPTGKQTIDFQQSCQWRRDSLFNKRCWNYPVKRTLTHTLHYIQYKNQLEMDHRYTYKN